MDSSVIMGFRESDLISLAVTVAVSAIVSFSVCAACFAWFRHEQRRNQARMPRSFGAIEQVHEDLFLTGRDPSSYGELVAQFKVNQGKQVVSVLEAEGKRFIHVVGDLSPHERTQVVRYLRSEGFMS